MQNHTKQCIKCMIVGTSKSNDKQNTEIIGDKQEKKRKEKRNKKRREKRQRMKEEVKEEGEGAKRERRGDKDADGARSESAAASRTRPLRSQPKLPS